MSRRQFFGWMGAAVGSQMAFSTQAKAAANIHFTGYPGSFGVLHDISRCIGCRKCEAACNQVNELSKPETPFDDLTVLSKTRRPHADTYTVVNQFKPNDKSSPVFVKTQCNHCMEPACVSACFVKALIKSETGAVVYDASLCVGCRYCMVACPFNIPAYEYDKPLTPEITKCNLCQPRIQKGLRPGCVDACPQEALTFGNRNELIKIARQRIEKHPDRYVNHIYGENEMGGCNWLYISNAPFTDIDMREDLGITPAPAMTSGALAAVPVVVSLWVVFINGLRAISRRKEQIANEDKNQAVSAAVETEQARFKHEINQLKEKAKSEKEAAVAREVKKALEAAAQQLSENAAAQTPAPPETSGAPQPEKQENK
ncbi:MAG: 4Fe-4S dicluster domain-containing protein [Desulfobacteraceae bacterium]|nr:MAG: 4Fe-4S dicluster domain-containing protein [Desulfobacteraceae bacterium]